MNYNIWSQSHFELQIKIWKRTWSSQWNEQAKRLKKNLKTKNQAWPGIEPWRLRWPNATLYPLRKYMIHSHITTFVSDNVASSESKCQGSIPGHGWIFQFLFQLRLGCSLPCKEHVHLDHVYFHRVLYVQFSLLFPLKVTRGRAHSS